MSDWVEFTAKTVDEALTDALIRLETASDNVEYEVIEKESNGILGLFSKPAKIRVRVKGDPVTMVRDFLVKVFDAMHIDYKLDISFNEEEKQISIDISGADMGILIGKRGQTLDSIQYLSSLVANKNSEEYIKIKVDTENYRERRKITLENLAKNIASKVKRTHHSVALEPMNPYERRIIHSALQAEKAVETHSEGEEPYRKVVVTLKKGYTDSSYKRNNNHRYGNRNSKYSSYNKRTNNEVKTEE